MLVERQQVEEYVLLTLNRPAALNALNSSLLHGLREGSDWAATVGARALFITGPGERAFCAGSDIVEQRAPRFGDR